jgi:phosphonoacetate hydrolase
VHGISGNFYLDRASGAEIMMTEPALVTCDTILARMAEIGVPTAAVTAKDKLRRMLGKDLSGICFSSEQADRCTLAEHGITGVEVLVGRAAPDMYSADLSLYVLDAGIRLIETGQTRLAYLSLSDYVQHGNAPGAPEADAFHRALDERLARLVELGAVVALTADHGMNDKARADGSPNVLFLEEILNERHGAGAVRVICPITDPFVRHHGALGSFVRVYRRGAVPEAALIETIAALPGVAAVLDRDTACARFDLPPEREADFVVIGDRGTVLGGTAAEHDLSALAGHRLRSHGGLAEQDVPFLLSHPLTAEYRARAQRGGLRNFDIFDFALNGVAAAAGAA